MFGGDGSGGGGGVSRDNNEALARLTHMMMTVPPPPPVMVVGDAEEFPRRDERVPMWSQQETSDFIAIRGDLEGDFTAAKRNKGLWEVVAARMKELGYRRTPDQCKCKWKNLVSRYKGMETSDRENTRSFPFFDELHALFTERSISTPQTPFDHEAGSSQSKSRKRVTRVDSYQSLEEISEDEDEGIKSQKTAIPPRKKPDRGKQPQTSNPDKPPTPKPVMSGNSSIQEILHDFFQQQQMIDMQWRQLIEKHAYERQMFEQEWRQSMERIEMERMRTEQSWREKEEQRKMREESRAERRDALLTLLLNKLTHDQ